MFIFSQFLWIRNLGAAQWFLVFWAGRNCLVLSWFSVNVGLLARLQLSEGLMGARDSVSWMGKWCPWQLNAGCWSGDSIPSHTDHSLGLQEQPASSRQTVWRKQGSSSVLGPGFRSHSPSFPQNPIGYTGQPSSEWKCWVGQKVCWVFFHKIKDVFFIFTNNLMIWIFWYVWLSSVWLFSINVSIWSLSASTVLPDCGASSSEKSLAQNFTNHFWHVQSVTAPSPYTAQIFFCISVAFLLFLK